MTELHRAPAFFERLRTGLLGPSLTPDEVTGCENSLAAMGAADWPLSWVAYGLATKFHETAGLMRPVKEMGGPKYFFRLYDVGGDRPELARKNGNIHPGDGAKFFGRGDVQITWRANYERFGKLLGIDLVGNPNLALDPRHACTIMVAGMERGLFTGKKLADCLPTSPASQAQFVDARRIINGRDRAALVAGYALDFQTALEFGDWS